MNHDILFRFDTLFSSDTFHTWFRDLTWTVRRGEVWAVLGGNGCGKSQLTALLRGDLPVSGGVLERSWDTRKQRPALVSFEAQKAEMDFERWNDDSEFTEGGIDPGRTVGTFLGPDNPWVQALGLGGMLDRGLKFLSSGEFRKALLARELASAPPLLILDEPYEALDSASCAALAGVWPRLTVPQVFLLQRWEDLPPHVTHVMVMEDNAVVRAGRREEFQKGEVERLLLGSGGQDGPLPQPLGESGPVPSPLIRLRDVRVNYGEKIIFENFTWEVNQGEHWLITGPNGSGKTTLLSLINGENQQAYREDVTLFGLRRGSGETLWDLRRRQGVVSPALHQAHDHNLDQPVWAIVAGGIFDTIGLYEPLGEGRRRQVQDWLEAFGLGGEAGRPFPELSYGQQRMVLLVRALIKEPPLLILDEPCQGLDVRHTRQFLRAVDRIAGEGRSTVLYVTHRQEERLECLRFHLRLEPGQKPVRTVLARTE